MAETKHLAAELWVSVRRLAEATGETTTKIYQALYDTDRPMPCARNGRAIRVRLVDWNHYWDQRKQTVIRREAPRARRRKPDGSNEQGRAS